MESTRKIVIKENSENDLLLRKGIFNEKPKPTGKVFSNIEEAVKDIKPEDIEYITD